MTSLWQLTGPPLPSVSLVAGARFDTVVVGAGLTGVTTALLLARAGQRVAVLEARSPGAVTTGNTTGKLSLLQGTVLSEIRRHAGDEVLRAYVEANREGQAWLLRELETRGVEVEHRTAFTYVTSPEAVPALESEHDAARVAGLPVGTTTRTELPFPVAGALELVNQAQLHPLVVLAALMDELWERGGAVVSGCRVTDIESHDRGVRVETGDGTVTADACVLATGTPILDRGMFFARIEASRSFAAAYRVDRSALPPGMYVSADAPGRSLRTATGSTGEPVLVVGGGGHVTGRGGETGGLLGALDDWTLEHFGPATREVWWAAQDYRSHSRVPFAGVLPASHGRVFAATGYNKWGMTNGVAAALTLTAEILDRRPEWADALYAHRVSLPDAGEALGANAAVVGRMVSGWAGAEFGTAPQTDEIAEGEGRVIREGVSPVAVARVDGRVCRVSGVCTHMGGVLTWNGAERSWDCPLHGSRFSADGTRLEGPAVTDLEPR